MVAMAEVTLAIGAAAACRDGFPGELKGLVVDPRTRTVTHLVIEPEHAQGLARLVPLDHADAAADPIGLRYTEAEFKDLSPAEETLAEFVSGLRGPGPAAPAPGRAGARRTVRSRTARRSRRSGRWKPSPWSRTPRSRRAAATTCTRPTATSGSSTGCASTRTTERCSPCSSNGIRGGTRNSPSRSARVSGFEAGVQLSITKQEVKDLAP